MRIGDLSRRTGVPPATLRAWERRYDLLHPVRTAGGHRTYSAADLARVRRFLAFLDAGFSPARAGRLVAEAGPAPSPDEMGDLVERAWNAIDSFNEMTLRSALRGGEAALPVTDLLDGIIVPLLGKVAVGWRESPRNVAREHFASTLIRAHLVGVLGDHAHASGPIALAAAPPNELHDIGVLMAAVALAAEGWQPVVLGASTPWPSIEALFHEIEPELLLLGAQLRRPAARLLDVFAPPSGCLTILGGRGFRADDSERWSAAIYHGGPYRELSPAVSAGLWKLRT